MKHTATLLLLCAGKSSRMRGRVADKILEPLGGKPVFRYSLDAFSKADVTGSVVLVLRDPAQESIIRSLLPKNKPGTPPIRTVCGGTERQDSVLAGLESLRDEDGAFVFIHDAARPLVRPDQLQTLFRTAIEDGNATLARPVVDTIKQRPAGSSSNRKTAWKTLDRHRLWAVETPQIFRREEILHAYREATRRGLRLTDDCAALEAAGVPVTLVENLFPNPKLTHPSDWEYLEHLIRRNRLD